LFNPATSYRRKLFPNCYRAPRQNQGCRISLFSSYPLRKLLTLSQSFRHHLISQYTIFNYERSHLHWPGRAVTPSATHSLEALRQLLFPHYAVATLNTEALLHQPWSSSCALLVFPEGYEKRYTEALGTQSRAEIVKYVRDGGKLLAVDDGVAPAC
jgi:hypothetical protein